MIIYDYTTVKANTQLPSFYQYLYYNHLGQDNFYLALDNYY